MRTINDKSISIFDALNKIKENKYVIPTFQRQFVWDVSRIEKLWDSILLTILFDILLLTLTIGSNIDFTLLILLDKLCLTRKTTPIFYYN